MILPQEKYIEHYSKLRASSNYLSEFSPIAKNDTIFIIESLGDGSDMNLVSFGWNRSDTISCKSSDMGESYDISHRQMFSDHMMKLITDWDVENLKKEGDINPLIPQYINCATRIIFNGKKYEINCICFKDFFNLERDRLH